MATDYLLYSSVSHWATLRLHLCVFIDICAHGNLCYIIINSDIGKMNEKLSNSSSHIYSVKQNYYDVPVRSFVGNQLVLVSVTVYCGPFRSQKIKKNVGLNCKSSLRNTKFY